MNQRLLADAREKDDFPTNVQVVSSDSLQEFALDVCCTTFLTPVLIPVKFSIYINGLRMKCLLSTFTFLASVILPLYIASCLPFPLA